MLVYEYYYFSWRNVFLKNVYIVFFHYFLVYLVSARKLNDKWWEMLFLIKFLDDVKKKKQ